MTLNLRSHYSHKSVLHFLLTMAVLALFSLSALAQTDEFSRVKLKSGAQIVGKVIELDPEKGIKLELAGGKQIEISMEHIDEIVPTSVINSTQPIQVRKVKERHDWKDKGYYIYGNFGFPLGVDSWGDPSLNVSVLVGGGYTFNKNLSLGLTAGTDFYWWPNSMVYPVALEVRTRLNQQSFTPYLSLQGGYGFLGSAEYWSENNSGGLHISPGVGITSKYRENLAWYFQMGFRTQTINGAYEDGFWDGFNWVVTTVEEKITYNRLDLRFGFWFE